MNRVTYLSHSGFAVTTPTAILVFDMHRDPAHALEHIFRQHPDLPVIYLVTHAHPDHFNPEIFHLGQQMKRTYIMSNDIPARLIPSDLAVQGMSRGDSVEGLPGDIAVRAYGSTDEGVSYLVTLPDGTTIFHAGDLNDWHWNEESTPREVQQAHEAFQTELHRLAEEHPAIDIVMFPVDLRQGADYASGARQMLDTITVADFFPMHFNGPWEKACAFDTYAPAHTTCHCLHSPGESIALTHETPAHA